jgi:hypothetical protein
MADVVSKACDFKVQRGRRKVACGQPVPHNESTPITVGTTKYLMDLCEEHQDDMLADLEPYTSIAHSAQKRVGTQVRKAIRGKGGQSFTASDVRDWLREQGYEVSDTGRLPQAWVSEFEAAHQ